MFPTESDRRIIKSLTIATQEALYDGNYPLARKYMRTAVTLLNPHDLKTPTDNKYPAYDADKVRTLDDDLFTIMAAIQDRPQLAQHLEAALMRTHHALFEVFLKGAETNVD